jgi:uncharacterized protein YdeI (YjbR/CyaY-like superfamily)
VKPKYFATPKEFRAWLYRNHKKSDELLVGFYKASSAKPSITWRQSVDEALCFGWIDSIGRRIDDERYTIRFTPRRPRSNWSAVNIKRVKELSQEGLVAPAGLAAFEARDETRSAIYSYEARRAAKLDPSYERKFKAKKKAWSFFAAKAPSWQRAAIHWVMSAKKAETRERRLATLIDASAKGRMPPALTPPRKKPTD